jgi:hypothetical protein
MGIQLNRKNPGPLDSQTHRSFGEVRLCDFANPLPKGDFFVASPYPVDMAPRGPVGRNMSSNFGFTGSGISNACDRLVFYNADRNPLASGGTYRYAKTVSRDQWIGSSGSLRDESLTLLFLKNRSARYIIMNAIPSHVIPAPWPQPHAPPPDSDGDGLSDQLENSLGTDPFDRDSDADGLTDGWEYRHNLNPLSTDTDGDGMPDGWEVANGLDALVDDTLLDFDGDGVANREDARPNDSGVGRLSVSIVTPADGGSVP